MVRRLRRNSHKCVFYGRRPATVAGLQSDGPASCANDKVGNREQMSDREAPPLRHLEVNQYDINLLEIAEVRRRGGVIGSWLPDLTASALLKDPQLSAYGSRVSGFGDSPWTIVAAIDVRSARGIGDFANQVLSAIRQNLGGR